MTITRSIEMARTHLAAGNVGAYARLMSSNIRSAMSARAAKAFREAIAADRQEAAFCGLATDCPTAAR